MRRPLERRLIWLLAGVAWILLLAPVAAECPPQDLTVVLNTGWDESTGGAVIPAGGTDDDWDVIGFDPSGGSTPRDADVVSPHPAWLTLPDSQWIAADKNGPNGVYTYEYCWCMDDDFTNSLLSFTIRADDQATVMLNGNTVLTLPDGTFNDSTPAGQTVSDPALFNVGVNCLQVEVENKFGVVTGFNLVGTMTADDGLCCGCTPADHFVDDGSTGVDDATNNLITSGLDDDEWIVTTSVSGGVLPRPAEVIDTFVAWNVIPGTKWITADENGPNGLYTYEKCWCMNDFFENAKLSMELLADDRADVFLNGNPIGSTPAANAFLFPATNISTSDQSLFKGGENCVTIEVTNVSSVVTGLNVAMSITADHAECCPCTPLPTDAEAWWPLDEPTGPTSFELLNGYDGTWNGPVGSPGAYVNDSMLLDGIDDYVEVNDTPGLNFGPGQDFTIDAWIRTDTEIRETIVHKKDQNVFLAPGYLFGSSGPLLFLWADGTTLDACIGSTLVDDDQWHFVAVTMDRDDPAGLRLYIDGVIDATCDPTTVPGDLTNPEFFYIGADPLAPGAGNAWWDGNLDEIEIFRRALTTSEILDIYQAGYSGKCPLENCEDSTGIPLCDGVCPPGLTCVTGPPPAEPCECVPESTTCETSDPVCDGPCPDPDDICVTDIDGIQCTCQPEPLCEGMDEWPQCDAACPPGFTCEDNGQRCHCVAQNPCELSGPVCDGVCPIAGIPCLEGVIPGECFCPIDPPLCEGFATYPVCDGVCPEPDDICINNGQRCHCQKPEHCGDPGDHPVCDGGCPVGFTCEDTGNICECLGEVPACTDTFYPNCDGECPVGEICQNIVGSDDCDCVPEPIICDDPLYPACDGVCPVNQECKQGADEQCDCINCGTGVPVDPPIIVNWDSGKKLRWTSVTCALVYNVYRGVGPRLLDDDLDTLADDYGDCYIGDIIGIEVEDPVDPQPGLLHWYLVTAENFAGEGPLGDNSFGLSREATQDCP